MTCTGYDAAVIDLVQKCESKATLQDVPFEFVLEHQVIDRVMHIAAKYGKEMEEVEKRAMEFHEEWKG